LRGSSVTKAVVITLLALAIVLIPNHLPAVAAVGTPQPSTFYFHNQTTKTLNTVTTYLWANTTQAWSTSIQSEQRNVVSGTPGIWNYYSQPALAGNVNFTGPTTFVLYLVSTSGTGGGTVITGNVNKITSTGTVVALAVGSLSGTPISTTLTAYTISLTSSTYQIEAGAILNFQISISITGSTTRTVSLLYDVAASPSKVSAGFQQRLGINSYSSFNQTGIQTSFFSRNWTTVGRQVTLKASIFDALGLYDIASAGTNLTSPAGSALLTNSPLSRVQGSGQNYTGTWMLNWTYSSNALSGAYSSRLATLDNGGLSITVVLTFKIVASWYLILHALSLDPIPIPVPGASVTLFVGAVAIYNGVSNSSGWVTPPNIILLDNASYSIRAYLQGTIVNQTAPYTPTSSLTIPLYLSVYQLDLSNKFLDGNSNPLPQSPSSVQLSYPNGTLGILNPAGTYLLPAGTYAISGVIWKGVNVAASSITFNPRNGLAPVSLQIYELTVSVQDQNGQPISGATVTLSLAGQVFTQNVTGNTGVLIFHSLPKGQYTVSVNSQSQSAKSIVNLSQNSNNNVQLSPQAGSWVTQSFVWILLGVAVGGAVGYTEFYRIKHPLKEKPFEYLDSLTSGGFRDGDSVLIEGDTASGKTTICEELAHKSLQSAHPVLFLTYDNPDTVRQRMKTMHMDTSKEEALGFFQLVGCEITKTQRMDNTLGVLENFYDTTVLGMAISSGLAEITVGKPTVIIDSSHQLVERASLRGLTNLFQETSTRLRNEKGRLFLAINRSSPKSVLTELEGAVDGVLELSTALQAGQQSTQLAVKKMRGRKFDNRPVRIRIDPSKGLVFQIPKNHGPRKPLVN
jgi:KaiC/GvpD/RAD55 family RecA-like ATPase